MKITFKATNLFNDEDDILIFDDTCLQECPVCKKTIEPKILHACVHGFPDEEYKISIVCFCKSCSSVFIGTFTICDMQFTPSETTWYADDLIELTPVKPLKTAFSDSITNLSPKFVEIYNQSLIAEANSLDEIAGIGYRKALEFLIKDFAIHTHPADSSAISTRLLGQCINDFIDDHRIAALATSSTWIGNDETHYVRKHASLNLKDMKEFINAIVHHIEIHFVTEKAVSLTAKN